MNFLKKKPSGEKERSVSIEIAVLAAFLVVAALVLNRPLLLRGSSDALEIQTTEKKPPPTVIVAEEPTN